MSDPMNTHPENTARQTAAAAEPPRSTSTVLIWILILLAVIALGWYFYSQRTAPTAGLEPVPPATTGEATTAAPAPAVAPRPNAAPPARTARASRPADRGVVLVSRTAVSYPPDAFRAREEGRVLMKVQVAASGEVGDISIIERSGSKTLDQAAVEEVRKWTFSPAIKDGKAIDSSVEVPVAYSLDKG